MKALLLVMGLFLAISAPNDNLTKSLVQFTFAIICIIASRTLKEVKEDEKKLYEETEHYDDNGTVDFNGTSNNLSVCGLLLTGRFKLFEGDQLVQRGYIGRAEAANWQNSCSSESGTRAM